jgi:hypothetical protein
MVYGYLIAMWFWSSIPFGGNTIALMVFGGGLSLRLIRVSIVVLTLRKDLDDGMTWNLQ